MNEIIDLLAPSEEQLENFASNPDIITVSAEQFEAPILELFETTKLPRQLRTVEDVYAACTVIYAVSQDSMEPEEEFQLLEKAGKLALIVFDEKVAEWPITFVSAFTAVVSKLAEIRTDEVKQLIEMFLNSMEPGNNEQAKIIICNFLMELINRNYYALSLRSLLFAVEFFARQNEEFKLIELICLGYCGNTVRKIEEEVANQAFECLRKCVDVEDDVFVLIHQFIVEISTSGHEDQVIQQFFLVFLLEFAEADIHNIIAGLLCTSHKIIGVKLAQHYMQRSEIAQKEFLFVIENLALHCKGCDDEYLAAICQLVESMMQHDTIIQPDSLLYYSNVEYKQNVVMLVLFTFTVLLSSKRLATHLREVSETIATRRFIVEYYSSLMRRPRLISEFDELSRNMESAEYIYKMIEDLKLRNSQLTELLKHEFTALHEHLILGIGDFVLEEVKLRLQDDSEMVKRTAMSGLTAYLEGDPTKIGVMFTDMLLIEDQPELALECFEEFVVRPIEEANEHFAIELFDYLEELPVKLFESTFAVFLKNFRFELKDFMYLIEENRKGAYIVLKMLIQYSQPQAEKTYSRIAAVLHAKLLDNYENGNVEYKYILYCLGAEQLHSFIDFDPREFALSNDAEDDELNFEQLVMDREIAEIKNSRAYFEQLVKELGDILQQEREAYEDSDPGKISVYIKRAKQTYSRIIAAIEHRVAISQGILDNIAKFIEPELFYHPFASVVLYYLLCASEDVEFRLGLFEKLLNMLGNVTQMNTINNLSQTIANNALIAAFSAVYQYPDELGQFTSLLLDNDCVKGNYLVQRHVLYIIMDLHQLSLIKMDFELFNNMFKLLLSHNEDLRSLAERLLLTAQLTVYFVKFFRLCMSDLAELNGPEREDVYIKIISRLDQVSKYELLNQFLQSLPTSTEVEALDLFSLIESGAVTLTIEEEYEKAASILKRLNAQYTVQSVLPRLMERLCSYNAQKVSTLQIECVKAIQAVCEQMHVEYDELVAEFGSEYCLELLEIKW